MTTNAQLAAQMTDLVTAWQGREDEFRAWLAGTATGGPNSDGKYPMTSPNGVTQFVDCPAKLSDLVDGPAGIAQAAQVATEAARDGAVSAKNDAELADARAGTYRDEARDARDLASLYRDEAASHAANLQVTLTSAQAAESGAVAAQTAAEASAVQVADDATQVASDRVAVEAAAALFAGFDPTGYVSLAGPQTVTGLKSFTGNISAGSVDGDLGGVVFGRVTEADLTNGLPGAVIGQSWDGTLGYGDLYFRSRAGSSAKTYFLNGSAQPVFQIESNLSRAVKPFYVSDLNVEGTSPTVPFKADGYTSTTYLRRNGEILDIVVDQTNIGNGSNFRIYLDGQMRQRFDNASNAHFDNINTFWLNLSGDVRVRDLDNAYADILQVGPTAFKYNSGDVWHAGNFDPASYYTATEVDGLLAGVTPSVSWTDITGKPTEFTPAAHTHVISDVTGLQTELDGKAGLTAPTFANSLKISHATVPYFRLQDGTTYSQFQFSSGRVAINVDPTDVQAGSSFRIGVDGQVNNFEVTTSGATVNSNAIWHAGNFDPTTKADAGHTHTASDIADLASYTGFDARYYTEAEVDALLTGSGGSTFVKLASDLSVTGTTAMADVLSFTPSSNTLYEIEIVLLFKHSDTSNQFKLGVVWPTGVTHGQLAGLYQRQQALNEPNIDNQQIVNFEVDSSANYTSAAFGVETVWRVFHFKGILSCGASTSGQLKLQIGTDRTANTSYAKAGSFLKATPIS